MTAVILDGRALAAKIRADVKGEVERCKVPPGLATIMVGEDPASRVYVNLKQKACEEVGIKGIRKDLAADISEENLLSVIDELNEDDSIHGILLQLPLPGHLDLLTVLSAIDPNKDVDGFHPVNMGSLVAGDEETFVPATPKGVMKLLKENEIEIKGKEVVIVNHSTIVGKPLALLFLNQSATVTVCHEYTKDLPSHTKKADILVTGVGKPGLITAEMVKDGAVVVDVGTAKVDDKIVGDVDFEKVKEKASYITPVPGG
ncbi:MAG: bifunctional 5,10-methylenetetrahydrofolate dehydrogenase/5,10-methenyltetrahydrofolate cyclohydrolase, partial [Candidatus Altiarchaeota archaeon]